MALADGKIAIDGSLFLDPTDYTGVGGTALGLLETIQVAGFNHDFELMTKQNFSTHYLDARLLATNLVYQVTVGNRSTELTELMFHDRFDADDVGVGDTFKYGHRVPDSQLHSILVRPEAAAGATKPHLYIPRAFVSNIGPVVWGRREPHVDQAILTIVALWDRTLGAPALYGDPTTWGVLQP